LVHENLKQFIEGFRYDAHPMGILIGTVGALSTFYPEARHVMDLESRRMQTRRLIGKMPTIAAFAYRHSRGLPYVYPDNELSYAGNFLAMLFKMTELRYKPNPTLERTLDILFTLHADHEQNCSANAMRSVGSSQVDPYSAVAAATAALYGPLHGGANEAVIRMLMEIGDLSRVDEAIRERLAAKKKIMGFGHRVYTTEDPRATHLRRLSRELAASAGDDRWYAMSRRIEEIVREEKGLNCNVDFYSASTYYMLGIPPDLYTPIFALSRCAGWTAHVMEQHANNRLIRPRAEYLGPPYRQPWIPLDQR
jgi:citrate synthase